MSTEQVVPQAPAPPPADLPLVPSRPAKGRRRWLDIALAAAVLVAVAGGSFAAGRLTAPAGRAFGGFAGGGGANGLGGGGLGGDAGPGASPGAGLRGRFGGTRAFQGAVVSMTADQLTIKLSSGQTIQIPLTSTTAYHSQVAASSSDVKTGSQVLVQLQPQNFSAGNPTTGQLPAASEVTLITP